MFRMPPEVDPTEELRQVRADVRNNLVMFATLCAAIRIVPYVLKYMNTAQI